MSRLNPEKLFVDYRNGVTPTAPIAGRKHTLTHSDATGELFLTIGNKFAFDKVDLLMRDEVLGEFVQTEQGFAYHVHLLIDGGYIDSTQASMRERKFRQELPLALQAIRYGDRQLFHAYPQLDLTPILVHFHHSNPNTNQLEAWNVFLVYNL